MQSLWQLGIVGRIQSISSALAEQSERDSIVSSALVLCFSHSLDSFSFCLSGYKRNCVYFTSRSITPWLLSYLEQQENQKGMNLEHKKTDGRKFTGDGVQEEFIQVRLEPL